MQSVKGPGFVRPGGEQVESGSVQVRVISEDLKECVGANSLEKRNGGGTRRRLRQGVRQFHQDPFGRHQSPGEAVEVGRHTGMGIIARVQPGDQGEGVGEDGHRFGVPRR
jgi:hypothetical protein